MRFRGLNKLQSRILQLLLVFIIPVISCHGQSNSAADNPGPKLTIAHDTIDYGIIPRNSNPYRYIKFTNTGNEPFILSVFGDVVVPVEYPHKPIQPGESGEIKISYPTNRVGPFMNFIGVNYNTNPTPKIIYVKGWVLHAGVDSAKGK